MKEKLSDINSRKDIKEFLAIFYGKAEQDNLIGEKFRNLNMDEHIDLIADFWDSILFGTNRYHGDPFGKHIPMALEEKHFSRWIKLFTETTDEMFSGQVADEMKNRGKTIAGVFQHKLARN